MKEIFVQAQADHIESLFKATPLAAIEELVWNALDANASEVQIDLVMNPLGGIEAIRVSDDGTGIDVLKVDSTFGSLGGSWKRAGAAEGARRLHGRHGRGRFKAFALGTVVEWRTTMRVGSDLISFLIKGEAERPGVFTLDAASPGPGTGTEVYVCNTRANCASLLDTAGAVEALASKFALYLKSYPSVKIFFNGIPVTPVIVQKKECDYRIETADGAAANLKIIEWKRRFVGAGRLVWAGSDGFQLHEQSAAVRSGGIAFTAYLVSPRFAELGRENAFLMEELNPEVASYMAAARAKLKEHFAAANANRAAAMIASWKADGIYPYGDDEPEETTRRFDETAPKVVAGFEDFAAMKPGDKKIIFSLIKSSLR